MRAKLAPMLLALAVLAGCQSGPEASRRDVERRLERLGRELEALTNDSHLSASERSRRMERVQRQIGELLEALGRAVEREAERQEKAAAAL